MLRRPTQTPHIAGPLAHSKNMRHTFSFLLFLLSINLTGQVRGTVIDKTTGLPIQYANVFLQGKPIGATTNPNGNFEIRQASGDDILIISAIGYDSQQLKVSSEIKIIQLIPRTMNFLG